MSYAPISTGLHAHRKIIALGEDISPMGLWVLALSWATDQETDGAVPSAIVARLAGNLGRVWAEKLVKAGLWEGNWRRGYRFHDFLDWQRSASELRELRGKRRQAGYLGGKASAQARASKVLQAKSNPLHSSPLHYTSLHSSPLHGASLGAPPGAASPATRSEEVARATGPDSDTARNGTRYEAILATVQAEHPDWTEMASGIEAVKRLSAAVAQERMA